MTSLLAIWKDLLFYHSGMAVVKFIRTWRRRTCACTNWSCCSGWPVYIWRCHWRRVTTASYRGQCARFGHTVKMESIGAVKFNQIAKNAIIKFWANKWMLNGWKTSCYRFWTSNVTIMFVVVLTNTNSSKCT